VALCLLSQEYLTHSLRLPKEDFAGFLQVKTNCAYTVIRKGLFNTKEGMGHMSSSRAQGLLRDALASTAVCTEGKNLCAWERPDAKPANSASELRLLRRDGKHAAAVLSTILRLNHATRRPIPASIRIGRQQYFHSK
jgi:hypothetical protein